MKHRQIKMCYLRREPTFYPLPEGYSYANYSKPEIEKAEYVKICKHGLSPDDAGTEWFDRHIIGFKDSKPETDVFFIKHGEEYVACITAIFHPFKKQGYVHMVSVREDYRGKGLANPLNYIALKKLYDQGAKTIVLTTGEGRVPAVKGYLRAGFIPMFHGISLIHAIDAIKRWKKLLGEFGYEKIDMLTALGYKFTLKIKGDK